MKLIKFNFTGTFQNCKVVSVLNYAPNYKGVPTAVSLGKKALEPVGLEAGLVSEPIRI